MSWLLVVEIENDEFNRKCIQWEIKYLQDLDKISNFYKSLGNTQNKLNFSKMRRGFQ